MYKSLAWGWSIRAATAPPWRDRVPFGYTGVPFGSTWVSSGSTSLLSLSNQVLRLHSGCLRTCWIELSLQREHDFAILQELKFGPLFGHLLDQCPPSFRRQKHLRSSLGCSCGLLLRLYCSGIHKRSLLALLSRSIPSWVPFAALGISF